MIKGGGKRSKRREEHATLAEQRRFFLCNSFLEIIAKSNELLAHFYCLFVTIQTLGHFVSVPFGLLLVSYITCKSELLLHLFIKPDSATIDEGTEGCGEECEGKRGGEQRGSKFSYF